MKISFLVTYYNQEQYVRESMDSLLAVEKPEEWEILVGDDGSADRTRDIVQEYVRRDPEHIRLFVMPRETGIVYNPVLRASANRLSLLEHCTGDCFCILDGDDFYCDRRFAMDAVRILEDHQDIYSVMCGERLVSGETDGEERVLPPEVQGRLDAKTFLKDLYLPGGAGVHRLKWEKGRLEFIRGIGFFDDNDIVINSLCYGAMYYIHRCIYVYRQTEASIYNSMSETEKSVLNVQGYDIDCQLTGGKYREEMLNRCGESVFRIYLERKQLKTALGWKKYDRYVRECGKMKDSLALKILKYSEQSPAEKRRIRRTALGIFRSHPRMGVGLILRKLRKRLRKQGIHEKTD